MNDREGTGRRASTPPNIEPSTAVFERGSEDPQNLQINASQQSRRQRRPDTAVKSAGLTAGAVAQRIVQPYLAQIGVVGDRFSAHALRVTAATLALRERADLNEVRHFLGHACITTTTAYDRRWSDENQPVSLLLPLG